ncbi:unnamed protein product [Linum trigynum]|uniref:Uncharacterized protein n=1 Tax=Linum trigynum TaxID=586398 RepID=A0AAV2GK40_9ROSI
MESETAAIGTMTTRLLVFSHSRGGLGSNGGRIMDRSTCEQHSSRTAWEDGGRRREVCSWTAAPEWFSFIALP